jgi:hypothetical protein
MSERHRWNLLERIGAGVMLFGGALAAAGVVSVGIGLAIMGFALFLLGVAGQASPPRFVVRRRRRRQLAQEKEDRARHGRMEAYNRELTQTLAALDASTWRAHSQAALRDGIEGTIAIYLNPAFRLDRRNMPAITATCQIEVVRTRQVFENTSPPDFSVYGFALAFPQDFGAESLGWPLPEGRYRITWHPTPQVPCKPNYFDVDRRGLIDRGQNLPGVVGEWLKPRSPGGTSDADRPPAP